MQNLYALNKIKRIHIEITSNCNSACPQCDRFIKQDYPPEVFKDGFKNLKQGDLSPVIRNIQGSAGNMKFDTFKNCINTVTALNLQTIEFNGTWGDAIMHPELDKFIEYIIEVKKQVILKNKDSKLGIKLATNGAIRSPKWWSNLANTLKQLNQLSNGPIENRVVFGIDGLDNITHQLYRRGCDFDRVMENAQAFIDAGGHAEWQWIEFKHNEHQIEDAVNLADKMGFKHFFTRGNRAIKEHFIKGDTFNSNTKKINQVTGKFDSVVNSESQSQKSLDKKLKNVEEVKNKTLEYTQSKNDIGDQIRKQSFNKIKTMYKGNFEKFLNEEPISCEWGIKGSVNVEFNGMVHPCCHMNNYMNNIWRNKGLNNDYENMQNNYDKDWNNINKHKLQDILSHSYYTKDLENSWENKGFPRLQICKDNCTQKVDEKIAPFANSLLKK